MSSISERQHRVGESAHHPFRSDRFYHANNQWYFLIRGGAARGPYRSRNDAEKGLRQYIETQSRLSELFQQPSEAKH